MDKLPLTNFSVDTVSGNGQIEFDDQIDKIINLHFFRKLAGKTQVILSLTGPSVRTRLTHTVEVARIARKLCDDLGLNSDLAEAIALAHDLGHTPFGHVGERTLKEIMCGCDTLKGKINETDFVNSGFKHNLQSFHVLSTLEKISDHDDKWPYILWGVAAHSSMTWSKPYSGMENEILISCKHCDRVYCCFYHEKKECKRNIQIKKKIEEPAFRIAQFTHNLIADLCRAITNDLNIANTTETIEWLNGVLTTKDLYDQFKVKKKLNSISGNSQTNLMRLKDKYDKSNAMDDLMLLNRLLLQEVYPLLTPKIGIEINTCQPVLCAGRQTYKFRNEVNEALQPGEKKEHFIGWFKDRSQIWCNKKCYLSELAAHKMSARDTVRMFPYFFDHPFPNSFYAPDFFKIFGKADKDYISVEAVIVSQADEIAQRQQDLEDAVSTKLIPFKLAKDEVEKLTKDRGAANNQKELGEKIVKFYVNSLKETAVKNFKEFAPTEKPHNLQRINIYCLMNLLYSFDGTTVGRQEWIIDQIEALQSNKHIGNVTTLANYFQLNYTNSYLHFVIYDILEKERMYGEYDFCRKLLPKLSKIFPDIAIDNESASEIEIIHGVNKLREVLKAKYWEKEFKYFMEPHKHKDNTDNYWLKLSDLNLYSFYVLRQIFLTLKKDNTSKYFKIDDLRNINSLPEYDMKNIFKLWKKILKTDANRVLADIVKFTNDDETKKRIDDFHDNQKDYILKSEIVEKNDGKAGFILKRLFKAFISNSHQLPDDGLNYILLSLTSDMTMDSFLRDERETFVRLLKKIRKTSLNGFEEIEKGMNLTLLELSDDDFTQVNKPSNEIQSLIDKRKKLWEFACCFIHEIQSELPKWINSEVAEDKIRIEGATLKFRGVLDNPILNAMPYWKSLLTRGICDYIASRTDQEAIDQYEKLYASAMELI